MTIFIYINVIHGYELIYIYICKEIIRERRKVNGKRIDINKRKQNIGL